jgi:branched-subunit amino acid aminotransferase/4-amino-4-deoxychorismate lyase
MRQRLLQRYPAIAEKTIQLEDALSAQALIVCSALRGLQPAHWLKGANGKVARIEAGGN